MLEPGYKPGIREICTLVLIEARSQLQAGPRIQAGANDVLAYHGNASTMTSFACRGL